jgi:hypothetical protein
LAGPPLYGEVTKPAKKDDTMADNHKYITSTMADKHIHISNPCRRIYESINKVNYYYNHY